MMNGQDVAIDIRDLAVRFASQSNARNSDSETVALTDINLQFDHGSITAIVGPSGCGKSTLLRCIASLTKATQGDVQLHASIEPNRRAFVFQSSNLLPWRDVLANVVLPLELQGVDQAARAEQGRRALKLVDLQATDADKLPHMLSGGMQMRVSLARALVTRPQILLLDEPFAALDDILRQELNEQVMNLWLNEGWTTIFVTHNVSEAVFLSQRIVLLSKSPGQVVDQIEIPRDYPRTFEWKATAEFAELCGQVSARLRESVS